MKAMILAAGKGTRMGDLTQQTPKPLLSVQGRPLIEHALAYCRQAGIEDVVINVHTHAEQIMSHLGDGHNRGFRIQYSDERAGLQGTGGGVVQALPLLGDEPFLLLSADIVTDFDFSQFAKVPLHDLAHLVLVNNPEYNSQGDFGLSGAKVVANGLRFTYANIALLSPALFDGQKPGAQALAPILWSAIEKGQLSGEFYNGHWFNVGTPEILDGLNQKAGRPVLGGCKKK